MTANAEKMPAEKLTSQNKPYPDTDANPDFVKLEEEVLRFWQTNNVFKASVENRPANNADGSSNDYIFYDGPPFANGLPHYGHLLTGYVKDMVARYQTMRGHRVERRFGWDCHGLPAEMGAEKELGISGRQAITEYGIGKFNDYCRTSVMKYTSEWERYVTRQARWVDFHDDYKTMDTNFMESVIWAFKELHNKGLIYESYRVMPYSWAAETPLSNFETKLDNAYRDRTDKAVYVAFELDDESLKHLGINKDAWYKTRIMAWTTTPWTLPSNLALAVHPDMDYALADDAGSIMIATPSSLAQTDYDVMNIIKGKDLINLTYKPLFPYFADQKANGAFRILDGSEFIEEGSGTGVVHMAPAFGEEDFNLCKKNNVPLVCPVDGQGKYTDEVFDIEGLSIKGLNVIADTRKAESEPYTDSQLNQFGLANLRIVKHLKDNKKLIKEEQYIHSYPHCWRTDTPIIYRAMSSWYVAVTKFRDRAVEINGEINWIPSHIRDGAMGHMLATAPDWSISRNRFWGCPIPIWRSDNPENKEIYVFGSLQELRDFFGVEVTDLHRPFIDELTKPDPLNPAYTIKRVEDVFDCWFESGSMPFAQLHYPFENKERFEQNFPAHFITEYIGQTRGWFNTLIMLSTALFDKPSFLNCICHGVVLDEETGQKYSKRLKNYKDPMEVFDKFGADALRWMMLSSPVMRGADIGVDPEGRFIRDVVRLHIKPIYNAYNFFCLYANADNVRAEYSLSSDNVMDKYILAKLKAMVDAVRIHMDNYDAPSSCEAISRFVEVLNNWYIRRCRPRFWAKEITADKQAAYNTLYSVLHTVLRVAAPLLPMTTETIFLGLTGQKDARASVHLQDFPTELEAYIADEALMRDMDRVQDICNAAHAIRNTENIRIRQPLATLTCYKANLSGNVDYFANLIADETNVKTVNFSDALDEVASLKLKISFPVAGKRLGAKMKAVAGAVGKGDWSRASDGSIVAGGEPLLEGEYEMLLESKIAKGAQALSSNDALVVLDLALTPALAAEGLARDVVRMVQQARKDGGLEVSDHILLTLNCSDSLADAILQNQDYICTQVLARSLTIGTAEGSYSATGKIEGDDITVGITRA
jgi:isoleucyl-tRNA synthetase